MLPESIQNGHVLVYRREDVEACLPQWLTVGERARPATEVLLLALVHDRDAVGHDNECGYVDRLSEIRSVVREPRNILILLKVSPSPESIVAIHRTSLKVPRIVVS